jgi:AcrR family transcriptional regulator
MSAVTSPAAADRTAVISAALELFHEQGFEATSVDQIARAAAVSRSTFFRQFGGKEDVVFADHEVLLDEVRTLLDETPHDDPFTAVCEAAAHVFRHFAADPVVARRRYEIVRRVPALREREIVTVFRYERIFDEHLRRALPGIDPVDAVGFSALVTAVHNHVLRRLLRGEDVSPDVLRAALAAAADRFGVGPGAAPESDEVVVAVFPRRMPRAEVARRLRARLDDAR